jgi:hypothetical protein
LAINIAPVIEEIRKDSDLRKAVENKGLSTRFLHEIADCFWLYGENETIQRLKCKKKRTGDDVTAAKRLLELIAKFPEVNSNRSVTSLIIKTLRLQFETKEIHKGETDDD